MWLEDIVQSYVDYSFSGALLQRLAIDPRSDKKFSLRAGILRIDQCIWVGAKPQLHHKLVSAFHDSAIDGHSGFPVTYKCVRQLFRWAGMRGFIKQFVQHCLICQQAKPERVPYPGLLQPLPIPTLPWERVSMDFVEGLPTSGRYNCLLVVIDKLTKYGHFIPLQHPFTAVSVAEACLYAVYRLHGMPLSIVSDCDQVFTSVFWKELFAKTGTLLRMSFARHPQTDGYTERVNQQLECFLRCFVSAHPTRWAQWIPLCEFWYNTNWHSATGQTPFEVVYGHTPRHFGISVDDTIQSEDLKQWLDQRKVVLDSVQQHMSRAQQRMKVQADKHHTERSFHIGDFVFLKLQPYLQSSVAPRANHKLAFKFYGPFQIIARVGEVAYELALPPSSKVHPVFHVSLLKVLAPGCEALPQLPSSNAHLQVPVEILQQRVIRRGSSSLVQVLVRWSDSSDELATWEDKETLKQMFPRAPAWGQAVSKKGGILTDQASESASEEREELIQATGQPRREPRLPARLAGPEWA